MRPSFKKKSRLSLFCRIIVFFILLLIGNPSLAHGGTWNLGNYQFLDAPSSGPLLQTLQDRASLSSYSFVGGVGGVAFGALAFAESGSSPGKIDLTYNSQESDGKRLLIQIDKKLYHAPIYDWMLIPIARYADSQYNACVSLFGPRATKEIYDIIYHPALVNTLLGIRLLHADILFFDVNQTWQLPKYEGTVILGKGEVASQKLDYNSARSIQSVMRKEMFQSWLLTDVGIPVRIAFSGDTI